MNVGSSVVGKEPAAATVGLSPAGGGGVANRDGFRPELDGLRALAIVAVLLFHFDLGGAEGGFAGVDVFFVLSGFLVTGMLVGKDIALSAFYRRRFWRIIPAYLVTIAFALVLGAWLMLPVDVERLGMSAVASTAFLSNVFFSAGAGYFDSASIYKPLLHTWSLAVEIQFYLVWPFVIRAIMWLRESRRPGLLLAIVVASFCLSLLLAFADPKAAFFSLPSRIWEFGLGGLVAVMAPRVVPVKARSASALRWLGLAAVILTPWLVHEGDAWPAPTALPACLGVACIIRFGGGGDVVTRLLATRPLTFLGQISYSLYLVHWPVVVFVSYARFPQASVALRLIALAACLPLAMALHRFVETPLRSYGRRPVSSWRLAAIAVLLPASLLIGGFALHRAPSTFSASAKVAGGNGAPLEALVCQPWQPSADHPVFCKLGSPETPAHVLVWGDSHALHLAPGLMANKTPTLLAAKESCPPIPGLTKVSSRFVRGDNCLRTNAAIFQAALGDKDIDTIVIAARWAFYARTTRFGAEKGSRAFLVEEDGRGLSVESSQLRLSRFLVAQVEALRRGGKRVVIIGQTPEMGFDASRCVSMQNASGKPLDVCDRARSDVDVRQESLSGLFASLERAGAMVIDPRDVLCDARLCHGAIDRLGLYRDDNHLSATGSALVARQIAVRLGL